MGCFLTKNIQEGTAFKLDVTKVIENGKEADEGEASGAFFVAYSFSPNEDPNTRVIFDGELTTFSKVREHLLPEAFAPRKCALEPHVSVHLPLIFVNVQCIHPSGQSLQVLECLHRISPSTKPTT